MSRIEDILEAKANGDLYTKTPLSRLEELFLGLNIDSGGSGGAATVQMVTKVARDVEALGLSVTKNSDDIDSLEDSIQNTDSSVSNIWNVINEANLPALQTKVRTLETNNSINSNDIAKNKTNLTNLNTFRTNITSNYLALKEHAILDGDYEEAEL